MIDIHTIGAGGGSIARVTAAGLLQVGAGQRRRPSRPDLLRARRHRTDRHRRLTWFSAGSIRRACRGWTTRCRFETVRAVLEDKIGRPLGLDAVQAATAIIAVATNHLAGAIRMVSVERGQDPRDYALFAFGGAGPLHATALAAELGPRRDVGAGLHSRRPPA